MAEFNEDDLFKKILENPPPMRPDLEALEDMNKRLDAVRDKRRGVVWWWVLPLLLLPLLFSSIFFYFKYQNAKEKIYDLNLQLTNNQNITKQETLTQRITIYEYDTVRNTVFQNVYVERTKEIPATFQKEYSRYPLDGASTLTKGFYSIENVAQAFNTFDKSSLQPSQLELLRNGKVISLGELALMLEDNGNRGSNSRESQKLLAPFENIETISFLKNRFQYEHPLPASDHFLNLATKTERDKINPLWYFVPTGFQAGINWSPVGIGNFPGSDNNVSAIGFLGELEFTKNTRLQLGLSYLNAPLKAENTADINQFPMISPDNPSDLLKEIYGNFTYLEVPLIFRYIMNPDKKWRPTFGIGMIARLPLKQQLQYEFISNQSGEYTLNQPLSGDSFSMKNIRGTLGVEYNFYQNYVLQVEGFYNYEFSETTNPYFNLRYGGLNLGLKYKF